MSVDESNDRAEANACNPRHNRSRMLIHLSEVHGTALGEVAEFFGIVPNLGQQPAHVVDGSADQQVKVFLDDAARLAGREHAGHSLHRVVFGRKLT
jgi:hypothetical protein